MNVYTKQNACVRTIPPHIRPWQACEFAENARVIRFFWSKHFQTFCIDGWPSRRYRHVSTHIFYSPIVEENISFLASSTLPVESQSIIPTFEMTINPFLPPPTKNRYLLLPNSSFFRGAQANFSGARGGWFNYGSRVRDNRSQEEGGWAGNSIFRASSSTRGVWSRLPKKGRK